MQTEADVHDTPARLAVAPSTAGVGKIDHLKPFQASARVSSGPGLCLLYISVSPMAIHAFGDVHDTDTRSFNVAPGGLGVA